MPRVHKNYREGMCSRFTNESKFERCDSFKMAQEAIREGEKLRRKIEGHRILESSPILHTDTSEMQNILRTDRELMNAFRL